MKIGYIVFFMADAEPQYDDWFATYEEAEAHVKDLAVEWEAQGRSAKWLIVRGSEINV